VRRSLLELTVNKSVAVPYNRLLRFIQELNLGSWGEMDGEFRIGRWNVDSARGVIAADEQVVQLEPRVMDLLVYLAEHSDEVLSKERLIQSVWPDTFVADDVLTSAIWKLRQALGDDPKKPAYIQTLPRRGYQLLAEVVFPEEEIEEATSRFQLVRKLGEGAMAEVHLAEDRSLGRKVALKFLMAELEGDSNSNRRLRREARAAAALDHPFICKIYDTGRLEGRSFIAMEFLEGQTLKERLEKGHLPIPEALRIASEMAEALEVAHKKGILHRDIKPSNILLTEQGHVKITDFGIAKRIQTPDGEAQEWTGTLTQEASSIGTLPYMSPEQVKGEPLDQRSDLFSLGVVLYEMLTGLNPYFRSNQAETAGAVLHEQPSPLSEHSPEAGRLESCVRRMLAKDPNDRYQSASDVIAALQELPEPRPGAEVRPYPGLASFTAEQSDYFFGREIETDRLWQKLHRSQFLGLIGPSGGGKSSFLRAGVTPAAPDGWAIIITTPGNRPFLNLAQALSDELPGDPGTVRQLLLFEDPEVALALVSTWRNRHDEGLIALDQFEELFTLNSREVQEKFVGLLGRLVRGAGIHLLLSMRDDFLFRCHGFETLEPIFAADLTPIGPPEGSALRQALVEPARKLGFRFEEEALVEEMLEAVEGELGTLPLLAFSAEQLWVRRDEEQKLLTRDAYEEIGGVEGALAGHAEATLERIGSARISIVRELFRNLTTARGTRSVQSREQLLSVFEDEQRAEASRVLDELIDARLLVSSGLPSVEEGEKTDRIEIVHESLLTNWPRLVRWQTQDAEGAQLRDELRQAAHLWDSHDRSIDLLWTGTAVREYELWRERYPGGLSDLEEQFGDAMTLQGR
jgi:serine/threonine protein kinase